MASKCRVQNGIQHSLDKASYAEEIHTKTKKIDISEQRIAWFPRIVTPYCVFFFHLRHAIPLNMNSCVTLQEAVLHQDLVQITKLQDKPEWTVF